MVKLPKMLKYAFLYPKKNFKIKIIVKAFVRAMNFSGGGKKDKNIPKIRTHFSKNDNFCHFYKMKIKVTILRTIK